jgi:hypothetical protein
MFQMRAYAVHTPGYDYQFDPLHGGPAMCRVYARNDSDQTRDLGDQDEYVHTAANGLFLSFKFEMQFSNRQHAWSPSH